MQFILHNLRECVPTDISTLFDMSGLTDSPSHIWIVTVTHGGEIYINEDHKYGATAEP